MEQVCRDPATASARKVSARKEALARSKEKKAIQERYKKSVTIQRNKDAFKESTWQVWPLTHFYSLCILFQNRRCVWSFSINDLGSIIGHQFLQKKPVPFLHTSKKTSANSKLQIYFKKSRIWQLKPIFNSNFTVNFTNEFYAKIFSIFKTKKIQNSSQISHKSLG